MLLTAYGAYKEDLPNLNLHDVSKAKTCPYCGERPQCVPATVVYGKKGIGLGFLYQCKQCDAYVGCHKKSIVPLGRLANKELRYYKKLTHSYLDPLWGYKKMNRNDVYKYLSQQMNIPTDYTHVGMFSVEQCKQAINHLKIKLDEFNLQPYDL